MGGGEGDNAPPPPPLFEKEGVHFNQLQHYYGLANLMINTQLELHYWHMNNFTSTWHM